ncbi:MAG TPA: cytochrome c [Acidimicrobiales bacterium]
MFRKLVDATEVLALAAAAAFVALMLFYRPTAARVGPVPGSGPSSGAAIFAADCASCHGPRGEGELGPQLSGGAVMRAFPNEADQVALVTDGRGGMPAWAGRLTPEQIKAVVDYTRSGL